jgi:hypothetical protein
MYCPDCGNENSADQKFCRSCGLGLEKIAQSLGEQLPAKFDASLQARKEKLERLGVAALSVFGVGILGLLLYTVVDKFMQGRTTAGLGLLALIVILGCGLLSVFLFASANEAKEAAAKRQVQEPAELTPNGETKELLPEAHPEPVFSVAERTTELLSAGKKRS